MHQTERHGALTFNEKTFRDRGSGFMIDKAKKILKYFVWYNVIICLYSFATICTSSLLIHMPLELLDWIFNTNLVNVYYYYIWDKILLSGSQNLIYFKFWLLGIPFTYLLNIRERGWKIR